MNVLNLETQDKYLAERKQLIGAREGFFAALRTYLRPGQRIDGAVLGDRLHNSPARSIHDTDWVCNPTRGYVTLRANPDAGRIFRLSVLQQGNVLRIGVRLPREAGLNVRISLSSTFPGVTPTLTELTSSEVFVDWEFDASNLYRSAQDMETALFRINALMERALQLTVPNGKEHMQ